MKTNLLSDRKFLSRKFAGVVGLLFLAATLGFLGGCSPGAGIEGAPGASIGTSTTSGATGTASLTLALTDDSGAKTSSISTNVSAMVSATLRDASGALVSNAVVTFGTDTILATIFPAETALTNSSGVARVTIKPASSLAVGATTITATAEVGGAEVTGSANFSIESTGTAGTPTLTLALTDADGATVASITGVAPGTVKATLKDGTGAVVPNAVVTFSTDTALADITPAVTALTDAAGVATVTLQPANLFNSGATTISATAQVGTAAVTGSLGYAVGSVAFTVTAPKLGIGALPLSAFGTTSVTSSVTIGGVPIDRYCTSIDGIAVFACDLKVVFSSICGNAGKAVLTSASVVDGVAQGSYKDNGCTGTDVITATVAGVASPTTTLAITPQTTGSIQFVSATPSSISLKGIGGTEAAIVRFKVLDTGGNPISGKTVTFGLSTTVGGISLTPSTPDTATSDPDGLVLTTVNSGTVSTPVRVTASTTGATPGTTLTTQSNALTITTGIPDQDSFSLGATILNPEFLGILGNTTVVTARLADHFNNPVPDGTVVNFTTEGGSIVASCSTTGSSCSSTLTSQAPRPADGRVTVLAYAVGEESFIDLNGNGVADLAPDELIDSSSGAPVSTDLGEAFRDDNENGVRDANETFLDFNQNGEFDGPDRQYSGVLCDESTAPPAGSSAGTCSPRRTIHVRKSIVIVFSGSNAVISKISPSGPITLTTECTGESKQIDMRIVDVNGNAMPAGTRIEFATSDGTISGNSSFTAANTNATPAQGVANYSISIRDDGVISTSTDPDTEVTTTTCTDTHQSGVLSVTVTTPGGTVTTAQYPIN